MKATRAATRREMRAARAALGVAERLAAADAVADTLASRPELRAPGYVAGYWAVGGGEALRNAQCGTGRAHLSTCRGPGRLQESSSTMPMRAKRP